MKVSRFKQFLSLATVLLLLLVVAGTALAAGTAPKDVPTTHWAYQAVKTLLDKGYLQLYQDQTFQGDQPVDRYTLASVVAKILAEIASGSVGTTRDDVKLLRGLTNEFREELVKVLTENSSLTRKLEDLTRQDQVFKEELTQTNVAIQDLTEEQLELQEEVRQLIADTLVMKKKVEQLEADVAKLKEESKKQKLYIALAFILGLAGAAK